MLCAADVAPYLIARGLLAPAAVVAGDCAIRDASRRHANWEVRTASGPAYLLKQGGGPARAADIAREAAVYDYLRAGPVGARLRRLLPAVAAYDAAAGVLVLELVRGAVAFGGSRSRPTAQGPARALGAALGRLHRVPAGAASGVPAAPSPGVLRLHRPDPAI